MVPLTADESVVNSYSSSTRSIKRYGWLPSVGIFATACLLAVVWVAFGPPLTRFSKDATSSRFDALLAKSVRIPALVLESVSVDKLSAIV
jgi:hypothetical protein